MRKLEGILEYASENNGFYKRIIDRHGITNPIDITQYPILKRRIVQKYRYQMFSDGYRLRYNSQQLVRQASSGSSGIPVNVYWDYRDWYASNFSLWRKRLQWYGIRPGDKCVRFTLNAFHMNYADGEVYCVRESNSILTFNTSLIRKELEYCRMIELINEYCPTWMYIQPFLLRKLIQVYKKYKYPIPSSLRYIESVGELLTDDLRNSAKEFFGVPLANMYGSEEMNGIAYECPHHNMHILDDNVLVEVWDGHRSFRNTGMGEAVITNLNNRAMPLIRYHQDDRITVEHMSSPCLCGGSDTVIQKIYGRTTDSFMVDDFEINTLFLMEIMADVLNQYNEYIAGYQFIYAKSENRLLCYIEQEDQHAAWFSSISRSIERAFINRFDYRGSFGLEILRVSGQEAEKMNTLDRKRKNFRIVE